MHSQKTHDYRVIPLNDNAYAEFSKLKEHFWFRIKLCIVSNVNTRSFIWLAIILKCFLNYESIQSMERVKV